MPRTTPSARPRRTAALTLTAGALLAFGPGATTAAFAQGCVGQPGTSALEQYCEAIPRGDGGRDTPGPAKKGSGSTISKRTGSALSAAGADGAAVSRLAQDGSGATQAAKAKQPPASVSATEGDAGAVKGLTVQGPSDPDGSPLSAATSAVQSGPTAGPALAWGIVGMSAIGAIAALMLRRRAGSADPTDPS